MNGHIVYHFRALDVTLHFDVNCLRVEGNRAVLSGVLTKVNGTLPPGFVVELGRSTGILTVVDNGEGKDNPPDIVSDIEIPPLEGPDSGNNCSNYTPVPYLPIQGNVQVLN